MYFATDASEILIPNFRSSLRIRGAPQMTFSRPDGSNQLTSFPRNLRPSRSAVTNLPGPIPLESSAVPSDDSFRFNDDQGGTPSRPESRQPNPKTPIGTIEQEAFGIWSSL